MSVNFELLTIPFLIVLLLDGSICILNSLELDVCKASASTIWITLQFTRNDVAVLSESIVYVLLSNVFVKVLY